LAHAERRKPRSKDPGLDSGLETGAPELFPETAMVGGEDEVERQDGLGRGWVCPAHQRVSLASGGAGPAGPDRRGLPRAHRAHPRTPLAPGKLPFLGCAPNFARILPRRNLLV